jgi:hypothetical protein
MAWDTSKWSFREVERLEETIPMLDRYSLGVLVGSQLILEALQPQKLKTRGKPQQAHLSNSFRGVRVAQSKASPLEYVY